MSEKIEQINKEMEEHSSNKSSKEDRGKFLVFDVGSEKYGIPLNMIKEVIGLTKVTTVPNVPKFFKGIINLRGQIISVIDFRSKLGLPKIDYEEKMATIIIAEIGSVTIGTIVDGVSEVASFDTNDIENNFDLQRDIGKEYITGVAKGEDGKLTLLIDIGKVLNVEELELVKRSSKVE